MIIETIPTRTFMGHSMRHDGVHGWICVCGVTWVQAISERKPHVGTTNEAEDREHAAELDRLWETICKTATGGGVTAAPAEAENERP